MVAAKEDFMISFTGTDGFCSAAIPRVLTWHSTVRLCWMDSGRNRSSAFT